MFFQLKQIYEIDAEMHELNSLGKSKLKGRGMMPFLVFFAFFLILFLQFPLSGSLPGSTDNWWYLGVFNELFNNIHHFFAGKSWGNSLYPENGQYAFGEPSFGSAVFFFPFKLIGLNDLWAYYFFHCLLFTSNACGIFYLSGNFLTHKPARFFSAFVFSSCAIMFGLMDDQKVIVWAPALFALHFFFVYSLEKKLKFLVVASFLTGFTVWFSGYLFFFLLIIIVVFLIGNIKQIKLSPANGLLTILIITTLVAPFAYYYPFSSRLNQTVNNIHLFEDYNALCLHPSNLFQALPNNLFYPEGFSSNPSFFFTWHSDWLGITVWALFFTGLFCTLKFKKELFILFWIGLFFALGPILKIGETELYLPFYPIFKYVPGFSFIRIPIRAFQISLIIISIFAGKGLEFWANQFQNFRLVFSLCLLLFLFENIPYSFQKYPSFKYLSPGSEMIEWARGKQKSVCLILPSGLIDKNFNYGFSISAREEIYMYWQTQCGFNMVNGTGYLPKWRWENQIMIDSIQIEGNLEKLIVQNKLDYIIWIPRLQLFGDFPKMDSILFRSDLLEIDYSGKDFSVFSAKENH